MSSKIVITGGAGFIGSHLARLLTAKGAEVVVFDSLLSGSRTNVPEGASVVEADIRNQDVLAQTFTGADAVVHLAALVSVSASIREPEETREVNVRGTENVFAAARIAGVRRVVYASSAGVYGNDPVLPKTESMALHPQTPYAESKVENEKAAARFAAEGLSIGGLRFFNVYGAGQRADHADASVISRWVQEAKREEVITIHGDGSQTRDFVHVSDVASAIECALRGRVEGVLNIASGTEVSLGNLLEIIREIHPIQTKMEPPREGDILRSVADISRARAMLGWSPRVLLRDGIRELFI